MLRQLLVESFVLAAAGCLIGCFFAWLGIKELFPLIPYNNFPRESVTELNWIVLLAAMGLTALSTVLCGPVPATHAMGGTLLPRLSGAGQTLGGYGQGRPCSVLAIAEVALSIVLLIGAGLMMRTFFPMTHHFGYDALHIFSAGEGGRAAAVGPEKLRARRPHHTVLPGLKVRGFHRTRG